VSYTATGIKPHGFHRAPTAGTLRKAGRAIRTGLRAARILATSKDLPLVLRALFVIGLVQIPCLPTDEIALAIALLWMFLGHRDTLRAAIVKARQA
jgi:hypothetical protein